MRQLFEDILRLFQEFPARLNLFIDQSALQPVSEVRLRKQQKRSSGQRKNRNDEHPGQLGGGVHLAVKQVDHHRKGEQPHEIDQDRQLIRKINISAYQNRDLHNRQQGNHEKPAEYQAQKPFFDRFGKPYDALFFFQQIPSLHPFCFPGLKYTKKYSQNSSVFTWESSSSSTVRETAIFLRPSSVSRPFLRI